MLIRVSMVMINTMTIKGGKGLFLSYSCSLSSRKSGQESEGRNLCRGHGGTLLTGLLLVACLSKAFYSSQDNHRRDGSIPSELVPPTTIISQENSSQPSLQSNLVEAFSQMKFSFLK